MEFLLDRTIDESESHFTLEPLVTASTNPGRFVIDRRGLRDQTHAILELAASVDETKRPHRPEPRVHP